MRKTFPLLFVFLLFGSNLFAQVEVNITLINDGNDASDFRQRIRTEIESILSSRFQINFQSFEIGDNDDPQVIIQRAYDSNGDIILGLGFQTCNFLAQKEVFPKPTILSFIIDNEIQSIPITPEGSSGVPNLNYIQSPFNIPRDFQVLYDIKPYEEIAIVVSDILDTDAFDFSAYLDKMLAFSNASYKVYELGSADAILSELSEEMDAAFLFPVLEEERSGEVKKLLTGMAQRGLPVFSLLSNPALDQGAYAAFETENNLARIPRRVAINVMKILEGQAAADLPVAMDNFTENLIINMQTARVTRHFPSWDLMADAILINVAEIQNSYRKLNLKSVIAEGLENNLGLKITQKETEITKGDIGVARSNYLPQLEASSTALFLDENSVRNSFGTRAFVNWTANASLSQLIISEPAMANIAIQKLFYESQQESLRENELDVVVDAANAYLGILQALAIVRLRNENVNVTRKNFDIAQAKEKVGYAGTSDVYRWESELALDNVDLNTAQAQLRQARFNLNALLNRPIKEEFELEDIELTENVLLAMDNRLLPLINNPGDLETFADFMVQEALQNLPEIKQIEAGLAIQERNYLSQKRTFFVPTLAFTAAYDYVIGNYDYPEGVNPLPTANTYNAAFNLSIPIFQGNNRRVKTQQAKISVLQAQDQMADIRLKLELQVRSNLETAGASFSNLNLSRQAAEAAQKNFEIAQDSYRQGLLNITSLIDAQNAFLQSSINATNAAYTFISDFLDVERSVGYFHSLALPQEQEAFLQRFIQFVTNR